MLNREILSPEVQRYLIDHQHERASKIALQKSPFRNITSSDLAQQIDGRQRVLKKIPEWLTPPGIYFPPKLNLEQCSSALTGKYKSDIVSPGCHIIDLTGGFGVDSFYFASKASFVTHCEINTELSEIVQHNFKMLGVHNVKFLAQEGITALQDSNERFDYIYIDPSRRVENKKVVRLQDCIPNVIDHQELFFNKSKTIITKLAPLLDISLALVSLEHVCSVYVLSVGNDCKELLLVQKQGFMDEPTIHAVLLGQRDSKELSFKSSQEKELSLVYSNPLSYLYDPDVAITKSGAFKTVAQAFDVSKLAPHTHLYTSEALQPNFPGRKYKVLNMFSLKDLKKASTINKANVVTKNFPLKVDEIRKKYKIQDGGFEFLYFCTLVSGEHVALFCQRLPDDI